MQIRRASCNIKLLHCGVNTKQFQLNPKTETKQLRFIFLGRLVEQKGIHHLIDALAPIAEPLDIHLDIIGTGDLEQQLKLQVKENGLTLFAREQAGVSPEGNNHFNIPLTRIAEEAAGSRLMTNTVAAGAVFGLAGYDTDLLVVLALGFGLLMLINVAATMLRAYVILYLSNTLGFQMVSNLFRHLLRLLGIEVLDQNLDGIARVQTGLQSSGFDHMVFGNFETRLANLHQELDRRLGL